MLRSASRYRISQLIYQVLQESALSRSQFVAALGYRNIVGALRQLDSWLDTGSGDPLLIDRPIQVYRLDPTAIEAALLATEAQQSAEREHERRRRELAERKNFRQHVFVETQPGVVRSSFTVAAIVAPALKTIRLQEDLVAEPESRQVQYVAELIRQHFAERGGALPLFGPVIGYRFVVSYDEGIRFDTAGNVIDRVAGHSTGPGGAIRVGQTTVEPTLLSTILGMAVDREPSNRGPS